MERGFGRDWQNRGTSLLWKWYTLTGMRCCYGESHGEAVTGGRFGVLRVREYFHYTGGAASDGGYWCSARGGMLGWDALQSHSSLHRDGNSWIQEASTHLHATSRNPRMRVRWWGCLPANGAPSAPSCTLLEEVQHGVVPAGWHGLDPWVLCQ